MPELPEVETVCRSLSPFVHHVVKGVDIIDAWLRRPLPTDLSHLIGQTLQSVQRRAKYIILQFDQHTLVIHLGMTGRLLMRDTVEKHDKFCLHFDHHTLVFQDSRRFGFAVWYETIDWQNMGIEPLSAACTPTIFFHLLQRSRVQIKVFLLDQKYLVGIGNIYACEALFQARISPLRLAQSLTLAESSRLLVAIQSVLEKSIALNGSTLRDYRRVDGQSGDFQNEFVVYAQEGKPCLAHEHCPGILRIKQHGRSTYYCPEVQI
jgi:formamidopyrimidine-DNA glycosylase